MFVIKHSRFQVGSIIFRDTKCSGKFCNCQNVLLNSNKSCGCFSLKSSCYNIISLHSIFFVDTGEMKMMSKFSSLNFLETFTKGDLSVDIRASRLQSGNGAYDDIVDYLGGIVDLVNSEGGWTVYGWCKRFFINVVSLLGNHIKEPGYNKVFSQ